MTIGPLNFERARYDDEVVSLLQCSWCGRGVDGPTHHANDKPICLVCALRALAAKPADTNRVFWSAVSVSTAVALVCSAIFSILFRWLFWHELSWGGVFLALGSGFAIGKSMRKAAKGAGGRRYQVFAALLTYAALSFGASVALLGLRDTPLYFYPFLVFEPIGEMFAGRWQIVGWEIFMISIGIRWAWVQLPAWPLKITAPLAAADQDSGKKYEPTADNHLDD